MGRTDCQSGCRSRVLASFPGVKQELAAWPAVGGDRCLDRQSISSQHQKGAVFMLSEASTGDQSSSW